MDFSDLEAANNHLDMILDSINAKTQIGTNKAAIELLKEEKEYLLKAPKAYNYYQIANSHVDKYSTIRYQNNIYSVLDKYVGKLLSLRLYPEHIEIFFNEDYICTHKRSYKLQEWQIKLEHYIPTLTTKPGALHSSMALKQTDVRLQEIYNSYFTNNTKEFISLMNYIFSENIEISNLCAKVEEISNITPNDVSIDKIIVLLERNDNETRQENKQEESIDEVEVCSQAFLEQANNLYANYQ